MIPVDSLLYKINQKLNKLSSNEHQEIHLEDKILALNEAQIALIKSKVSGFNPLSGGLGLEAFKKRHSDLQNLVLPYNKGEMVLKETDHQLHQWSADLTKLKQPFMFYVDSYVIASKGVCKDRQIWVNVDLAKHNDIQVLMSNEHTRPSFEWQETFNTLTDGNLNIYTDGTFKPSKIFLSYLRYPAYIDKEGYQKFDGENSVSRDCELEAYLEDELVDLAVQRLAMYTENPSAIQSAEYRMKTNE